MVDERTEDEQIEALKAWWKRNGTSLLTGLVLAAAIVLGWNAWQQHQTDQRMGAAARFQELYTAINTPNPEEGKQSATVTYAADQLRSEYGDSVYAVLGSLLEAGFLVTGESAEKAVESLTWALEHAGEQPMPLIIRERLARAQFILGEHEKALVTLRQIENPGVFEPIYRELEGDILKDSGDIEGARTAYRAAAEASPADGQGTLLEYKMADLAMAGDA